MYLSRFEMEAPLVRYRILGATSSSVGTYLPTFDCMGDWFSTIYNEIGIQ